MIYYETVGNDQNKDWIVLFHGLGGSHQIWYKQIDFFKDKYNLLLLNFRGHGKSKNIEETDKKEYTYKDVCEDVLKVLNELNIEKAHLMGISIGSIIIRRFALFYPERVKSMVLAGAVTSFNFRVKFFLTVADIGKNIIDYMKLYKLFAWIIMPRDNHKASRRLFVREAKVLGQKEFIKWFKLVKNAEKMQKEWVKKQLDIPKLYISGKEDYMFIENLSKDTKKEINTEFKILDKGGHVCNIDTSENFNEYVFNYLKKIKS